MSEDRRVKYTKMVIKESLTKLLDEESMDSISVKALCIGADINRATFYRHYKDIYHLFEEIEKDIKNEINIKSIYELTDTKVLTIIYKNKGFYKEFFRNNLLSKSIRKTNMLYLEKEMKKNTNLKTFDDDTFDYSFDYFIYGIEGLLKDWIDEGCIKTPEEFSNILKKIVLPTIK